MKVTFIYSSFINENPAEAWHVMRTVDPLVDSDDEDMSDYNKRIDICEASIWQLDLTYIHIIFFSQARRLDVLSRIRKYQLHRSEP